MSFNDIAKNYRLAKSLETKEMISEHWDVFNENFEKIIKNEKVWKRMLRNALTIGLNDNLIEVGNKRFSQSDDDLWRRLRMGEYDDLIFDINDQDKKRIKLHVKHFMATVKFTDLKFVMQNTLSKIGSPVAIKFKIDERSEGSEILCNLHDLDDIRHCWLILKALKKISLSKKPLFCEIGAGYGGLSSKIRKNIPDARFVIIDLPEVNALQTYYLSEVFPNDKILGLQDFNKLGAGILKEKFNFLILPQWTVKNLFKEEEVDIFINIRSMMEMNSISLRFYFDIIQMSLRDRGLFVCFNRYEKKIGAFINRFDKYPFDNDWKIILSKQSIFQPKIHNLIVQRYRGFDEVDFKFALKASLADGNLK